MVNLLGFENFSRLGDIRAGELQIRQNIAAEQAAAEAARQARTQADAQIIGQNVLQHMPQPEQA
jgi:hypothetical protein